jgi:hypothetical protein
LSFKPIPTKVVRRLFVRLLAGGRQAERLAQLCSAPGVLAGKGVPVDSSPQTGEQDSDILDQSASASASPSLASLHSPLPLPDLSTRPLGYLDPEARKEWMAGHPGLYQITNEGYVGVAEGVYGLMKYNSFNGGGPFSSVSASRP